MDRIFIFFLILSAPAICSAEMVLAPSFATVNFFLLILFFYLSTSIIKTDVIVKKMSGSSWFGMVAAFSANAVSIFTCWMVIYLASLINWRFFEGNIELGRLLLFLIYCFANAILFESIILRFFYRKAGWNWIFEASTRMNVHATIFVFAFGIAQLCAPVLVWALIIIVSSYFFLRINAFITAGKKISPKRTIILQAIRILLTLGLIALFVLGNIILPISTGGRSKARDAKRIADMNQLISAQEFYFKTNGSFFASKDIPKEISYYSATASKTEIFKIPLDPGGGNIIFCDQEDPAFIYCAIDNTTDPARFCYYARLENQKTIDNKAFRYFVATQAGWNYIGRAPKTLDDCDSALKIDK
jgi:hypothetical protein